MPNIKTKQGHYLYYQLIDGNPEKPCLVFLHEGLGCTAMWKNFPEKLCKLTGCSGLIYDRLGYGKSSALSKKRTVHYMHDYALNELPFVLEQLIPEKEFILIGHSDGGSISLLNAAEQPKLLKAVITEAAHIFVEQITLDGIVEADKAWQQGKLSGLEKYHTEKTTSIFKAWSETWQTPCFKYWNIEYALPAIEVPLLVIQGKDDQYGSIKQVEHISQQVTGKTETAIVDNCGHIPHIEASDSVMELMINFIKPIVS